MRNIQCLECTTLDTPNDLVYLKEQLEQAGVMEEDIISISKFPLHQPIASVVDGQTAEVYYAIICFYWSET